MVLCCSVIASEEYKAPYIAIVKSGIACILKQINIAIHMPGGKKVGSSLFVCFQWQYKVKSTAYIYMFII